MLPAPSTTIASTIATTIDSANSSLRRSVEQDEYSTVAPLPDFITQWSHRMDPQDAVKLVYRGKLPPIVKLNAHLFDRAVAYLGERVACAEFRIALLRELALLTSPIGTDYGSVSWCRAMRVFGLDPVEHRVDHRLIYKLDGEDAIAKRWAEEFPEGSWVAFRHQGADLTGQIHDHRRHSVLIRTLERKLQSKFRTEWIPDERWIALKWNAVPFFQSI